MNGHMNAQPFYQHRDGSVYFVDHQFAQYDHFNPGIIHTMTCLAQCDARTLLPLDYDPINVASDDPIWADLTRITRLEQIK